ncbi:hypothetical protein [Streptomyces sp. ISL-100]|uniref:hypothetical protein n=1 Tax=Streptomyces sp. ISL-100 TaxID=2819173 RepID=UPI001BE9F680|nr:hypothetical protein [Streptomyces sp. ISL-100]MBT2401140.1 hypothetical protein [Streptomyces sp. ISL-100]
MYDDSPPPRPARPTLDRSQRGRLDYVRNHLQEARSVDLASLDPAALIMLVERLRGGLDDMVRLITETHDLD